MKCPACGGAELIHDTRDVTFTYKGEATVIPAVTGGFCPSCAESVLDMEESRRFGESVGDFIKQVNASTSIPALIASVRKKLALDQCEATKIFGGGDDAFPSYEKGEIQPPLALVNLFKALDSHPSGSLFFKNLKDSKEMPTVWRVLKRHCKTEFEWIAIFNLIVWARRTALNKYKPKKIKTKHGQKYLEKRHYENIAKKALQLASAIVKFDADMRLPDLFPDNYVSFLGKYSSVLDAIESFLEMVRKNNPTCFEKIIEKSEFLISTGRNELLDASIYRLFWTQGFHAVWEPNFKAVASCDDWPPSLSLMLKKYSEYSFFLSEQALLVSRPNQRSLSGDLATRAFIFLLGTRLRIEYGQAMYDTVSAITNALFQHPPGRPTTKTRVQSILKQVS